MGGLPTQKTKALLFGKDKTVDFLQYQEHTNLSFGYGYSGALDFLDIHAVCSQGGHKNEDVFITNESNNLKAHLKMKLEALQAQGFTKIVYCDVENGVEDVLYDKGEPGKIYRLMHAKYLTHPDMINMFAISGPLSLATGDQSFMEAIQANKIICYDCMPHKELLYSAYQDSGDKYSPSTREALALMRLNIHDRAKEVNERLALLLSDPSVRLEISQLNESIREKESLVQHYQQRIGYCFGEIADPITHAIITDAFDKTMLAAVSYEHFALAIRYGRIDIVELMVNANKECLRGRDIVGNNAFVIAAQNKQYQILTLLLKYAALEQIPFETINQPNHHFANYSLLHYLPEINQNSQMMELVFASYYPETLNQQLGFTPNPNVSSSQLSAIGFYQIRCKNKWLALKECFDMIHTGLAVDSYNERLTPFLIVAREYLREKPTFSDAFAEVSKRCQELDLQEDWIYQHPMTYVKMLKEVKEFIEGNPALQANIGINWLPIPPTNHWQAIENALAEKTISSIDNEELVAIYTPFLIVMRNYYQNKPEFAEDLEAVNRLCLEISLPDSEVENLGQYRQHVLDFMRISPSLANYVSGVEREFSVPVSGLTF